MSRLTALIMIAVLMLTAGCGGNHSGAGGGSTPSNITAGANMQAIKVYAGPAKNYYNGAFTSVTVCVPGSSTNCQTIDGVLIDTGSSGLRLLSAAAGGALTLPLPQFYNPDGGPVAECSQFADLSYTWGSVRTADVHIAGEVARSVSVNVLGDPDVPPVPQTCAFAGADNDNLQSLGANGILGVGVFQQDCGPACDPSAGVGPAPLAAYYECAPAGCQPAYVTLNQQVQNPVALFATDNNGIIIELPAVSGAAASVDGTLVFGIGTQSNNALGNAVVLPVNAVGNFATPLVYAGQQLVDSFIDSGSNGIFFNTGLPQCQLNQAFYCPATEQTLSATNYGANKVASTVQFQVGNGDQLLSNPNNFVAAGLAGPSPDSQGFDWGLPFFFGRHVYVAIESRNTPAGDGPYWAY